MKHAGVMGTALMTDLYELTMLDAALRSGWRLVEPRLKFLPDDYLKGAVTALSLDQVASQTNLRFSNFHPTKLTTLPGWVVSARNSWNTWKARFEGEVWSYREGDLYVPGSPVLRVDCSFEQACSSKPWCYQFSITTVLSLLQRRVCTAANGRHLIEMGGRRTHEEAAVAAARAAWLVGFDTTSNMEAGIRFGVPTAGTSAHAFTLAHDDEEAAFEAQIEAHGLETTLLVDTYEIDTGIDRALAAAKRLGGVPGAIRIDSGDLAEEALRARKNWMIMVQRQPASWFRETSTSTE